MDYREEILNYINRETEILQSLDIDLINTVMNVLEEARLSGKKVFICGNGGSAATASHFCCDFNKGISENLDRRYDFECLNDNVPTMMAVANDVGYEEIFRYPLKCKMKTGDIFIGISGSGNSSNVVNAMEYAREIGGVTIAIVGYDGGRLKEIADYSIHVRIHDMQIAEDIHLVLDHCMMHILSH